MDDLGLNEFLQPVNSPITQQGAVSAFSFNSNNERDLITRLFLQNNSVGSSQIATASIGSAQIATASIDSANINTVAASKIAAGTVTVAIAVGTSNIKLDGANNRMVINDGTVDRIYVGSF